MIETLQFGGERKRKREKEKERERERDGVERILHSGACLYKWTGISGIFIALPTLDWQQPQKCIELKMFEFEFILQV